MSGFIANMGPALDVKEVVSFDVQVSMLGFRSLASQARIVAIGFQRAGMLWIGIDAIVDVGVLRMFGIGMSRSMIPFQPANIRCKVCKGLGSGKGRVTPGQPTITDPEKGLMWWLPIDPSTY